jgi:formyltetrahydrofolate deformylase
LVDLLYRHQSRELACLIPQISSNHADNQAIADFYNIPYVIVAVAKDNQIEAGANIQALIDERQTGLHGARAVHANSFQRLVNQYPKQIINIHHSFLPAFVGARPYHQASERGAKLIGAHQPLRH